MLSGFTGHKISFKFTTIKPQGRRTDEFTKRYWAFDSHVSFDITIDGKPYHIENLAAKAVLSSPLMKKPGKPGHGNGSFCRCGPHPGTAIYRPHDHQCNRTAAVATLLGEDAKVASKRAETGAYLTKAIPGARDRAFEVARLAKKIYTRMNQPVAP